VHSFQADSAYVVIDKPAMLPSQAHNSNGAEATPVCAAKALDRTLKLGSGGLFPVHRLDTCTEGCFVLARNPKAQAQFKSWLQKQKVGRRAWRTAERFVFC
jgi:23S rRNA-/tRNA-specific pseudouridylate synthase